MADNAPPEKRLEALDDRRRNVRVAEKDIKYSSIVARLRWFLPIIALGIVAALLIWPKIEIELAERRFAPSKIDAAALKAAATQNKLINANFSSIDSKGRPITIVAKEAVQQNDNPDMVNLTAPQGTFHQSEVDTMTAQSATGTYAQAKQILTMATDVVLTRSDGTVMNTQQLTVDLAQNNAHTDMPIDINGPRGHLTAQAMDVSKGGTVAVFKGPAKLIINPAVKTAPPAPTAKTPENKS